ncbi:hypothetical protein CR513_58567, partial [Mucuna pruriens]
MVEEEEKLDMCMCKILPFLGDCKLEEYIDWELKVDQIVSSFDLHGRKVVRLVTLEFGSYALLQRLHQGLYSMEEYHKKMEMDLLRAQIKESEEATMAQFLHSLKTEIQDVVD